VAADDWETLLRSLAAGSGVAALLLLLLLQGGHTPPAKCSVLHWMPRPRYVVITMHETPNATTDDPVGNVGQTMLVCVRIRLRWVKGSASSLAFWMSCSGLAGMSVGECKNETHSW
jgi:hypothetical protein